MDIGAYMNIADFDNIAKENNIEVPRLRGYRLMKNEKPYTEENIKAWSERIFMSDADGYFRSHCRLNSNCHEYSQAMNKKVAYYIDEETGKLRWDRLHGKKRKDLKFLRKQNYKRVCENVTVFNKYTGRPDVLYIHARIGGGNWDFYGGPELAKKEWFLEKIDDPYDNTYCDIYAKIKEV